MNWVMKIYCRHCKEITEHRKKGTRDQVYVCDKCDFTNMPVTIVREHDGLTNFGTVFEFIEWNDEGSFKQFHPNPQIGYSCIVDPQYFTYSWLTTAITEIVSDETKDNQRLIEFKTKNSSYKLYIAKSEQA